MARKKKVFKKDTKKKGPFVAGKNWVKGMKSIFSYTDSHKFLRDVCKHGMKVDRGFTIQAFSERANLNRTFLQNIMAGRKDPSVRNLINLAETMMLDRVQTRYFIALREYSMADDKKVARYFFGEMKALRR